jgi:hypothetical protein
VFRFFNGLDSIITYENFTNQAQLAINHLHCRRANLTFSNVFA